MSTEERKTHTLSVWGEELAILEAIQRVLERKGIIMTVGDITRYVIHVRGHAWLVELEEGMKA